MKECVRIMEKSVMSGPIPNSIINTEVGDEILAVKSPQQALQIADFRQKASSD